MKKKLSKDNEWLFRSVLVSFFILFYLIINSFMSLSESNKFGIITAEIPSIELSKKSKSNSVNINKNSINIAITHEAFYIQTVDNSYIKLKNTKNDLDIKVMLKKLKSLHKSNAKSVAVLIPSNTLPMTYVIKTLSVIRSAYIYDFVVLGTGVI